MSIITLIKDIRDINRLKEILVVFSEEGLGYIVNNIGLAKHVPFHKRLISKFKVMEDTPMPVRIRRAFERLGPTFIKFGQLLSLRPDFVPKEYIKEFEKMQDRVPSFQFSEVNRIIGTELKQPMRKLFKEISHMPVSSASLSQVHKAVLKDGNVVAVKVQRPEIPKIIDHDIDIMYHIAHLIERYIDGMKKYHIPGIVEEFARWTHAELDFTLEAKNADRFRHNFKGNNKIKIPKVYHELSSQKVLTLEFLEGIELNDSLSIKAHKINIKKFVPNAFDAVLTQVFLHGFFHADPHPGNIILLKNNVIGLVDFGIVGKFNDNLKKKCIALFSGILNEDVDKIVKAFSQISMNIEDANTEDFKYELEQSLFQFQDSSLSEIKLSSFLDNMLHIALKYHARIPTEFVLFGKTIATLEGVALRYDPDFRIIEESKASLKNIIKGKLSVKNVKKRIINEIENYHEAISQIPLYAVDIMNKIREGRIKIDIEDTDIKKLSVEMEHSSGNIAFGMIIAALIVASALIAQTTNKPLFFSLPLVSLIGVILAVILALWLIRNTVLLKLLR